MARKDRTLPPVSRKITDYNAQHMETYHKNVYKNFLKMRQQITTEYNARATRVLVENEIYYSKYNLLGNIDKGSYGYELMRWHGMKEESIQEIINYKNSNDLERLALMWKGRKLYNQDFFDSIKTEITSITERTYGPKPSPVTEDSLVPSTPLSTRELAVWNICFGFGLFDLTTNVENIMLLVFSETRKNDVIANQDATPTIWDLPAVGDFPPNYDRVTQGTSALESSSTGLFYQEAQEISGFTMKWKPTLLSKTNFDKISQDDFFDIYSEALFIDSKVDTKWYEELIGGILKMIGTVLNLILDVLLNIPILGMIIEWIVEGIASLFDMTFEEARAAFIQAIITLIALYFGVVVDFSWFAVVDYYISAYSIGAMAGDLAAATYESPVATIEEEEKKELERQLEGVKLEINLMIGTEEPNIRLNAPEEGLRVNGGNNSTYSIFRLD